MLRIFFAVMSVANLIDLLRLVGAVQDRIIGRLDPDLAAALGDPLVLAGLEFAAVEVGPERAVFGTAALLRRDEHRMMLALDFLQPVTERVEKVLGWR